MLITLPVGQGWRRVIVKALTSGMPNIPLRGTNTYEQHLYKLPGGGKNKERILEIPILRKRLPAKKAIVAIARKMAKLVYRVMTENYKYEERGAEYFLNQREKWHSSK